MHRPGVELSTFRSLVQRPTTTLPRQPISRTAGNLCCDVSDSVNFRKLGCRLDLAVTRWSRLYSTLAPVNTWMGAGTSAGRYVGTPFWYAISHLGQLSLPSLRGRLIEYLLFWLGLGGARSLVSGGRYCVIPHDR